MEVTTRRFRCDDAAGYEFVVLRAGDGDFHLSVLPCPEDWAKEHEGEPIYEAPNPGSVRIRMPMIGGGSHEKLWHTLALLFRPESDPVVVLDGEECRWLFRRNVYWKDGPFGLREKLVGLKRRRRPNPTIEGVGTLDEFMKGLEASIRQGVTPVRGSILGIMQEFAERFAKARKDPFSGTDDPAIDAPVEGRSADVVTMDDRIEQVAKAEGGADVSAGTPPGWVAAADAPDAQMGQAGP